MKSILQKFRLSLATVGLIIAISQPVACATLRLMPIGDSITSGFQSSTNNGYRTALYNMQVSRGHRTDFVGSIRDGNGFDPDHEGHSGKRIEEVATYLNSALPTYQPNIVTLLIGTNDMGQNYQISTAPDRLAAMIDQIVASSPNVTVLVAQLIVNSDATVQARINSFNSQIPGIVQTRVNAGKHVYTVSMGSLNTGDLQDGLHPNDNGYQKMAVAWDAAIQDVIARGWVSDVPFAGVYQLQSVSSGQSVDVSGASTANAAPVIQWPYGGGRNQLWNFIPTSSGYYQIKNANSALNINVAGAATGNGGLIVQWPYSGVNHEQWMPVRNSDGSYVFYNRNSGLVLDNPGGNTQATQFDQWGANGGSNQRFNVIAR